MEPEGLLPSSQESATCLYLEPDEFGPQSSILFKIHCNIFHQCLSLPSGFFLSGFPIKFCMHFFSFPILTTCPDNFVRVGLTEEQQKIADNLFSFRDSNHVPRNSNLLGCWCFVTSCLSLCLGQVFSSESFVLKTASLCSIWVETSFRTHVKQQRRQLNYMTMTIIIIIIIVVTTITIIHSRSLAVKLAQYILFTQESFKTAS